MKLAYYNEFDSYAAAWLRNLIAAGLIAPGDVDERSIEDVRPDDLVGYTQCHFFAGIGVWSYALRLAGWPDDREIWTGSCPCQPFSAAGEGKGFADERHLWPSFFHLIEQRRPAAVAGEQVAGADADPWIDLVCADLERLGYAFGATPFPSAGVGAPHIRDRLYWVANTGEGERGRWAVDGALFADRAARGRHEVAGDAERHCESGGLAHHDIKGCSEQCAARVHERRAGAGGEESAARAADGALGHDAAGCGEVGGVADAAGNEQPQPRPGEVPGAEEQGPHRLHRGDGVTGSGGAGGLADADGERRPGDAGPQCRVREGAHAARASGMPAHARPGPVNGFWRAADWLACRDGRWRPVDPGTFPLAHGAPARVGRLRAYGNAINASAAEVFIRCVMDAMP